MPDLQSEAAQRHDGEIRAYNRQRGDELEPTGARHLIARAPERFEMAPNRPQSDDQDYRGHTARGESIGRNSLQMAERGGFEPPNPVSRINGFRDRRIQPLCHLSAR
jgi:hypothetical protein